MSMFASKKCLNIVPQYSLFVGELGIAKAEMVKTQLEESCVFLEGSELSHSEFTSYIKDLSVTNQ